MSDLPIPAETNAAAEPSPAPTGPLALPGARLAAERQAQNLTVEQVASQLNLAPRQIVALENDDFAALPGMVIVRGFVRTYAKLLKIDPLPLLGALVEQGNPMHTLASRSTLSSSFSESRLPTLNGTGGRGKTLPIAAGLAVLVVAGVATYLLGMWPEAASRKVADWRSGLVPGMGAAGPAAGTASAPSAAVAPSANPADRADVERPVASAEHGGDAGVAPGGSLALTPAPIPATASPAVDTAANAVTPAATVVPAASPTAVPTALPTAPATPAAPAAGPAAPAAPAASAAVPNPLVLNVKSDSWVEIKRSDNSTVVSRIIKGGSVETFDVSEPVSVTIGNIAGVEATLRGTALDLADNANGNVARLRVK